MVFDAWLPVGYGLPDDSAMRATLFAGEDWQIIATLGDGRALVARDSLARRWIAAGVVEADVLKQFEFGGRDLRFMASGPSQKLYPVAEAESPGRTSDALAFAIAFKRTRDIEQEAALQDAIYVERISRLLPTYSISSRVADDVVLGYWLTGGANVSVQSFRRLSQMLTWMSEQDLHEVITVAGIRLRESSISESRAASETKLLEDGKRDSNRRVDDEGRACVFELPGRTALAAFLSEHIIEIIQNRDRYRALGIGFPSAVVLHGPPGCGKTFAIDALVNFLGWPSFQIDSSSIGSPYIHETSRKVAEVFEKATKSAPSVLIIDEMEAFLANREIGSGHHRVEEVAEFLRRIPEAVKNEVLVIAMTNRIDMIDSAILRRGRFDHVVHVDYASEIEVIALLQYLLKSIPKEDDVDLIPLARQLVSRPLSDVTYVVREGARLAARSGRHRLNQGSLAAALLSTPPRDGEGGAARRIGFV